VRRGNEIDVVAAQILEVEHHPGQLGGLGFAAFAEVADLEILAEEAKEIAVGEEDRPRSPCSHQRVLFYEMGAMAGNHGFQACPAKSLFACLTVYLALPRAEPAAFQATLSFRPALD